MNQSKMQVFFLPFAGANVNSYQPLTQYLNDDFDCQVIELPGRGSRFSEPLLEDIDSMISFCAEEILERRNDAPWALFGHSLGAVLAMMVCDSDTFRSNPPEWLILSGRAAPGMVVSDIVRYQLPREALLKDLISMGGLQPDLLDHPELIDLIVPILRADFRAIETFDFISAPKLDVPLIVIGGTTDCISESQLNEWQHYTTKSCSIKMLPGGHFFIFQNVHLLVNLIQELSFSLE
jgi:surfactin synthase thioesterase subunit